MFNLETGIPYSVTEIVTTLEISTDVNINHKYGERRLGDLPESYANADKSLEDMCRATWNWQSKNSIEYFG